jgi:hypothetical protein
MHAEHDGDGEERGHLGEQPDQDPGVGHMAGLDKGGQHGEQEQREHVVEDRGRDHHLAERRMQQAELREHLGRRRDRRDRHGHADHHGEGGLELGLRQDQPAQADAARQRQDHAAERDRQGAARGLRDRGRLHLDPGQQDQEEDADLGDAAENVAVGHIAQERQGAAEQGEHCGQRHPGDQFAHGRRLAEPFGARAEGARQQQKHEQLQEGFQVVHRPRMMPRMMSRMMPRMMQCSMTHGLGIGQAMGRSSSETAIDALPAAAATGLRCPAVAI